MALTEVQGLDLAGNVVKQGGRLYRIDLGLRKLLVDNGSYLALHNVVKTAQWYQW